MIILVVNIIIILAVIVPVLLRVAFVTLREHKILGYIQIRNGPNNVGYIGIMQPFLIQ